ncbi:PAB-dependent poly(A)-specific ribonuclease subunit 3-like [Tropilaelaps mercedesae]|uniref:PAB-dependent poly(A)-specific ribonuclease subunit 3-like n=1 Tax=Tropilaelaps mercedesae TaxID=418985 RepID=A0A1V9WYQ8_9ACAR|nr:PAB-dependent poly(A)-specific ribonuclease subunit 3-like [Tropilaelaps mercedesae]
MSSFGPSPSQAQHHEQAPAANYQMQTVPQALYLPNGSPGIYPGGPPVPRGPDNNVYYGTRNYMTPAGALPAVNPTEGSVQRMAPPPIEYDPTLQCPPAPTRLPVRPFGVGDISASAVGYPAETSIANSNVGFLRPLQATRMPKEAPLATSLSNLSMQDINAQEFVPVSSRGSSSSLNNVSSQPMTHPLGTPVGAFGKGGPPGHLLRDRESPDNSPVIARRSYIRNPSPLTVNGGEYAAATGMYQRKTFTSSHFGCTIEDFSRRRAMREPEGPAKNVRIARRYDLLLPAWGWRKRGRERRRPSRLGANPDPIVAELGGATSGGLAVAGGLPIAPASEMIPPAFHMFSGPPAHVEHMKPKANAPSFFMADELRMELLNRYESTLNSRLRFNRRFALGYSLLIKLFRNPP